MNTVQCAHVVDGRPCLSTDLAFHTVHQYEEDFRVIQLMCPQKHINHFSYPAAGDVARLIVREIQQIGRTSG